MLLNARLRTQVAFCSVTFFFFTMTAHSLLPRHFFFTFSRFSLNYKHATAFAQNHSFPKQSFFSFFGDQTHCQRKKNKKASIYTTKQVFFANDPKLPYLHDSTMHLFSLKEAFKFNRAQRRNRLKSDQQHRHGHQLVSKSNSIQFRRHDATNFGARLHMLLLLLTPRFSHGSKEMLL